MLIHLFIISCLLNIALVLLYWQVRDQSKIQEKRLREFYQTKKGPKYIPIRKVSAN
jgi:hypothetical protein